MAGRLKNFVTGQKRFLGDAAHELCSPLARMEIALSILEERSDEQTLPYLRDVREEVTHMRKLANELLSFSRASLGENHLKLEPVNVAEMVDAAVRREKSDACPINISIPPPASPSSAISSCSIAPSPISSATPSAMRAAPAPFPSRRARSRITSSSPSPTTAPACPPRSSKDSSTPSTASTPRATSETGGVRPRASPSSKAASKRAEASSAPPTASPPAEVRIRLNRVDPQTHR